MLMVGLPGPRLIVMAAFVSLTTITVGFPGCFRVGIIVAFGAVYTDERTIDRLRVMSRLQDTIIAIIDCRLRRY